MYRMSRHAIRLLAVVAILFTAACGGGGSGSGGATPSEQSPPTNDDQTPEPKDDVTPDPDDLVDIGFSPAIPAPGSPAALYDISPTVQLTIDYPESGVPAGYRMIVSAYQEDPATQSLGALVYRRPIRTAGETIQRVSLFTDYFRFSATPDGELTVLVDVVVFKDDETGGSELVYAVLPRSRVTFPPQVMEGQTLYGRIAISRELEAVGLKSTAVTASYLDALPPAAPDDTVITIDHSSYVGNTLHVLFTYDDACPDDEFELALRVRDSDLLDRTIPTALRRTSAERCDARASRLITVNLDELVERYAAVNNSVFQAIQLQGMGSFTPARRTFETARRFGTERFCDTSQGCLASALLTPDGRMELTTSGNLRSGTTYSLSADGRTIYFQPDGQFIPSGGFATFSEDGQSLTLSFIGAVFYVQPDAYTELTVTGSIDVPSLDANEAYHAAVVLFRPAEGGIDVLARAFIADFGLGNADFRIEYAEDDMPQSGPIALQISAAVFRENAPLDMPAELAFRSIYPGDELLFYDTGSAQNVFESSVQTQVTVAPFSGASAQLAAEVSEQNLNADAEWIDNLQFAAIYDSYLHLILGPQSACEVLGGRFIVNYQPGVDTPSLGIPSRWLGGDTACSNPDETVLSVDLAPLMATWSALGEPVPPTLALARYGDYTPLLTTFPGRRVYVDRAGCFAQNNCGTYLDFRPDGTLYYARGVTGAATYGISIDGRTIFSEGIPLSPDYTTAFLSEDGQRMATNLAGELLREL